MKYTRKVYGYECDVYGHLNNANYLHLLEEARAEALEEIGFPIKKFKEMEIHIYVTKVMIKYKRAIELEDTVTIESGYEKFNRLLSTWIQKIYSSSGELCAIAEVDAAFIKNGKPHRISREMLKFFQTKSTNS